MPVKLINKQINMSLKIKEPDYKALYESRQAKIDSLNKTISGLKGRITRLENENKNIKRISAELDATHDRIVNGLLSERKSLQENICNRNKKDTDLINEQKKELEDLRLIKKQAEFIMRKIN